MTSNTPPMSSEEGGPTFHGGPLPFITISPSGECVVEEYAAKILSQIKGRVAVVVVAGMYRTGKSYLLNRLIGMQSGFEVGPSVNACTKGIWIWGQPVQLAEDYYAILVDTEGLGGGSDLTIFTLATLLSSFFVFNSTGAISEQTLDQLAVVGSVVQAVSKAASTDVPFTPPPLLWVLRDFNLKLVNEFNQIVSSKDYMEQCLKPVSTAGLSGGAIEGAREKNAIRDAFKNLFPDRDCLTMVRPVENEADLRQITKLGFEELRPAFRGQVETFVEKVYSSIEPKRMGSVTLNGAMLTQLAQQYCQLLNGMRSGGAGALSGLNSMAWSNVVQSQLRASLRDAVGIYRSILNEEGMKKLPLSDSETEKVHARAKTSAKAVFPLALLRSLEGSAEDEIVGGETELNASMSAGADMASESVFYHEFKLRRDQLRAHLRAENSRVSTSEMEKIFSSIVKQTIDPVIASSGPVGLLIESWRTVLTSLDQQCSSRYPKQVYGEFLEKQVLPKLITVCSGYVSRQPVTRSGTMDDSAAVAAERRKWTEQVIQLESQLLEARSAAPGAKEMAAMREMVKGLQEELAESQRRAALVSQTPAMVSASSLPSGSGVAVERVFSEISAVKDLVISALSEIKSSELDKRAIESKAEQERTMMELERRFTKQLNDARKRNEMMIDDLKNNYETEIVKLKEQREELQNVVRELERASALKSAEIEKLGIAAIAAENDKNLRSNFANVINQQSELVLRFLKNGGHTDQASFDQLSRLTAQASEMRKSQFSYGS